MKTIRLAAFALALSTLFGTSKIAMAAQVTLIPNQVFVQMGSASGVASVDTKAGIVKISVKNLPLDSLTHKPLPIMLQDIGTIPAMVKQAKSYQVYLLRIDEIEGKMKITQSLNVGVLPVNATGAGSLQFNNGGILADIGYNVVAVQAEEPMGAYNGPSESVVDAFSWRGMNGAIVMWGAF
jgi:hypothetical protein